METQRGGPSSGLLVLQPWVLKGGLVMIEMVEWEEQTRLLSHPRWVTNLRIGVGGACQACLLGRLVNTRTRSRATKRVSDRATLACHANTDDSSDFIWGRKWVRYWAPRTMPDPLPEKWRMTKETLAKPSPLTCGRAKAGRGSQQQLLLAWPLAGVVPSASTCRQDPQLTWD